MKKFWETFQLVNDNISYKNYENYTKADIKQKPCLQDFFSYCCTSRYYFFLIKKYDELSCTICCSFYCLPENFEQLYCLPDLVPEDDLHYKSFEEIYEQLEVNGDMENTTNSNEEANQENIDEEDKLDQFSSKSSKKEKPDENIKESSKSAESDDIVEEFDSACS
ncbi:27585_t:CDS:2 [Gigaspora margarita]|uniref:27585_t:CDS:1 n=1 Tax=Gigaspora margarita TaxID=4874 RepID=A0ABN7W4V7_GIGMA|nr:27585_t:CDS:2 [Gigaspora margarita]